MDSFKNISLAVKCAIRRRKIKNDIRKQGGRVSGNVKLTVGEKATFTFGKALYLNGGGITAAQRMQIIVTGGGKLCLGHYTGISSSSIFCTNEIIIGNHVNIGAECVIIDSNFHSTNWQDRTDRKRDVQNVKTAPIHIGDYVFIGTRCIINKGVTIGEKSIIAAGSVVVKDIPANCIAGGNPCKVIKYL
jgi:acetyltransferase-like isoleucine patch superfamily enzyme